MKTFHMMSIASVLLMLTGCVTGTRNIDIATPDYSNDITAEGNVVITSITDNRQFEAKPKDPSTPSVSGDLASKTKAELATLIGRQRNGYGAAMGDVALPEGETVMDKVEELLTEGIESRGYTVSSGNEAPNTLEVQIKDFWAWFSPGFATVSFEARIITELVLTTEKGEERFVVRGYGLNKGAAASNANWALAFDRAYQDFLKNLDATMDQSGR